MRLCLLGSGSKGNSIFIENRGAAIIIDQGFSHKELACRMEMRGLDPTSITGILVTHDHEDHIRGVGITSRKLNVPVYATAGTLDRRRSLFNGGEMLNPIESGEPFEIGPFHILPFRVSHDVKDPVQYCVTAGKKKITVATDLGFVSKLVEQCLCDADLVIIEANHDVEMLRKGPYSWELQQRIMSREGHLSNKNAADIIFNISSRRKKPKIVLAHLSAENNRPDVAERTVRELFERFDKPLEHLVVALQDVPTEVMDV